MADLALIPCQPAGVDLASTSDTIQLVRQARRILKADIPRVGVFLNRAVKGTKLKDEAISVLKGINDVTFLPTIIHQRQVITDAFGQGATVFDMTGTPAGIAKRELTSLFTEAMEIL
jgi:chromosome partitioning protein